MNEDGSQFSSGDAGSMTDVGISPSKAEKLDDGKMFHMQNAFCLTLLNPP
jgi:hypothetical protein